MARTNEMPAVATTPICHNLPIDGRDAFHWVAFASHLSKIALLRPACLKIFLVKSALLKIARLKIALVKIALLKIVLLKIVLSKIVVSKIVDSVVPCSPKG